MYVSMNCSICKGCIGSSQRDVACPGLDGSIGAATDDVIVVVVGVGPCCVAAVVACRVAPSWVGSDCCYGADGGA